MFVKVSITSSLRLLSILLWNKEREKASSRSDSEFRTFGSGSLGANPRGLFPTAGRRYE